MRRNPHLIVCVIETLSPLAFFLSRLLSIPYIVISHGTYATLLPAKSIIYKLAFLRASRVISVSNFTRNKLLSQHGIDSLVVNPGIDTSFFHPSTHLKKEPFILFVGNMKDRKGFSTLLYALSHLSSIHTEISITVIGTEDPLQSKYRQFILDHNIKINYFSYVPIETLRALYRSAFLNVLISSDINNTFEGYGYVHAESISCGTFTVGSHQSGNPDIINDDNGFLIDSGDHITLSQIISQVYLLIPSIKHLQLSIQLTIICALNFSIYSIHSSFFT